LSKRTLRGELLWRKTSDVLTSEREVLRRGKGLNPRQRERTEQQLTGRILIKRRRVEKDDGKSGTAGGNRERRPVWALLTM